MREQPAEWLLRQQECPPYDDLSEKDFTGDWDEWTDSASTFSLEDILDAFELEDEPEGPWPEYGDFWVEVEDGAI
jgi:hypothetical protein